MDNQPVQPPIPPTQTPIEPPTHKKNIILYGLLAVIILISVGTGGYLLGTQKNTPTTETTASISPTHIPSPTITTIPTTLPSNQTPQAWKQYTNTPLSFIVSYPSTTLIQIQCPDYEKNYFYLTERTNGMENFSKQDVVDAPTCGRDSRYTIEFTTLNGPFEEPKSTQYHDVKKEEITISGEKAYKYTSTLIKEPLGPAEAWSTNIYIDHKGKMYNLYLGKKELLPIFDQIIQTFTFTD